MKNIIAIAIVLFVAVGLLGMGALWLHARPPALSTPTTAPVTSTTGIAPMLLGAASTPSIVNTTVTPEMITVNTPTLVTVTAQITDPTVIPNSVNLLRLGAAGTQPTILAAMQGTGNGIYSFQRVFNEPTAGQIRLRVSAAFQGSLQRVLSNVVILNVWLSVQLSSASATVAIPPGWLVEATATAISASSPTLQIISESQNAEVPPEDFLVRVFPKPASESIAQFGSQFDSGWLETYAAKSTTTISGHNAIIYSDANSKVPHQPLMAALIDDSIHNQCIVVTILQVAPGNIEGVFLQLVSGIQFR